jgi:hypothetical protein
VAVAFNAAADRLYLSGGANPSNNTIWTVAIWVRRKSSNPDPAIIIDNDASGSSICLDLNSQVPSVLNGYGFTHPASIGSALTADVWYYLAIRCNGTSGYVSRGTESVSMTHSSAGTIPSQGSAYRLYVGGTASAYYPVADLAYCRAWNASLSDAELEAERQSATPVRTSNLFGDWRLVDASTKLVNSLGGGTNLTAAGAGPWADVSDGPSFSGSGTTGTVAANMPLPTLAASGNSVHTGTGAPSLLVPTLAATGGSIHVGTVAASTPLATLAAAGTPVATGAVAVSDDIPTLSASGTAVITGTIAADAPLATLAAAGGGTSTTGTVNTTAPLPTLAATGTLVATGSVSTTIPLSTLASSGTLVARGTVTASALAPLLAASGPVAASTMRVGVAHVAGLYNYPGVSGAQFTEGCDAVWNLGARTITLWATSAYTVKDYTRQTWTGTATTLKTLFELPEYKAQLDRSWEQVILTAYSFANNPGGVVTNQWRVDPSAAFMAAEYDEVREAAEYLLAEYDGTGRTFVLKTWEGDWALMDAEGAPDTRVTWQQAQNYGAFLGTRQRAVEDARKAVASDATVLHAMEANRVVDIRRYPHRPRVCREIARLVQPDVISYSAYDGTIVDQGSWGASHAAWVAATTPVFTAAIRAMRRAFPKAIIHIGEFGFPEGSEKPGTADIAAMVQVVYDIAASEGVHTWVYWQVFGNDETSPGSGVPRYFCTHLEDGTLTSAGTKVAALTP